METDNKAELKKRLLDHVIAKRQDDEQIQALQKEEIMKSMQTKY